MEIDPQILPIFLEEAQGHLRTLGDPSTGAEELYRAAHSLKGAAATLGLTRLESCAEAMLEQLRRGAPGEELALQLVQADAALEQLQDELRDRGDPPQVPEILEPAVESVSAKEQSEDLTPAAWDPETEQVLRKIFSEEAREHLREMGEALCSLEQDRGTEGEGKVEQLLRLAHTLKGSAATVGQEAIGEGAHLLEEHLTQLRARSSAGVTPYEVDRLLNAADLLGAMVETLLSGPDKRILQLLSQLRSLFREEGDRRGVGRRSERRAADRRSAERRLALGREGDPRPRVRVAPQRLEALMNQMGELLIGRTRVERRTEELRALSRRLFQLHQELSQILLDSQGSAPLNQQLTALQVDLSDSASNLARATGSLVNDCEGLRRTSQAMQEQLDRVYMTPIGLLHARLQRPLREMARSQGKRVELRIQDETSEMNRAVVDQITDPLIQLLRNAVVHGIEPPARRRAAGKSEVGRVELSVRHLGDVVYLEVEDDGAGIDAGKLRELLARRGRLSRADLARMGDDELLDTIFISGFSTREETDVLAGRGVGLDVVRQNISRLGGDIRLSSTPGRGTRFTIQMPLTTAIAQALLFKVGDQVYSIPVVHVEQALSVRPEELIREGEAVRVCVGDRRLPLIELGALLGPERTYPAYGGEDEVGPVQGGSVDPNAPMLPGGASVRRAVIIIRLGEVRFAAACTRVVGPREIVLKSLGALLSPHPLLAAATVSGSNKVQFVLDVAALARAASINATPGAPAPASEDGGDSPRPAARAQGTILLCDDSRTVREAVGHMLRRLGFWVDLAENGREAWEKLKLRPYGLLLTDLEMPRLHGLELISRCRGAPALARMPIVVLTSKSTAHNQQEALSRGAEVLLSKPVSQRLLRKKLEPLLAG